MMHSNGFIVSVRDSSGQVLRESRDREVFLPFYSNYSLRLKNNNNRKAIAKVLIDGTDVLGGNELVLEAYQTVNLERFCLDGNLGVGRKFEFVPAKGDSRVQDPTSHENGDVRVIFTLEKERRLPIGTIFYSQPVYRYHTKHRLTADEDVAWGVTWDCSTRSSMSEPYNYGTNSLSMSIRSADCCKFEEKGATVEGEISGQSFRYGSIGELESGTTEIILKLRPSKQSVRVSETRKVFCPNCGRKIKYSDNYCPGCGSHVKV